MSRDIMSTVSFARSVVPRGAVLLAVTTLLTGCATVRQDQVGLRATFGKIGDKPAGPGAQLIIPFAQRVITLPSRTVNREVRLDLPSKEGLNIAAEVSILYRIEIAKAPQILMEAGEQFEENVILPVFRSSAADVAARFMAKDMHSGERTVIERAIKDQMMLTLKDRGFVIESVLLKQIRLPAGLAEAVEQKLEAEQRAEQMRFVLERERQEAERRRIEAEGVRDAQRIISEGLTPLLLDYQSIQAFRELATSGNAKTIITDGKTPFLINPSEAATTGAAEMGPRRTIVEPRRVTPAPPPAPTTPRRGQP
jgi:regulator of protease activity HflC (stomatin/prohibitin superfamily)